MTTNLSGKTEILCKEIRLLLCLWDLGGFEVKKGDLNPRLKRKKETAGEYQEAYKSLAEVGAIAISKNKVSLLQPKGFETLRDKLNNPDFQFDAPIGAKMANTLLRWIRQQDAASDSGKTTKGGDGAEALTTNGGITLYDEFKAVALEVYNRLNRDYNLDNLVPIYRIRREIGDRVSRSQFNEWLLEMQADDIFQLQGGSVEDSAPDKIEDSITTKLSGLRCYAKLLQA
ncbi:MAG TPA: hypothetical protein DEG17_11225 [Cyanobacteria bacterium UBA11149]|nr:hypothetical protein [Cyanobacteria bacterium UBA11367]HBE59312.1 hypothetical protein [Cyanobacteria bacterium UBA11366]HBK63693.1 hypothetical protein [Cyanobacteria bacterium UBA11166]HBR75754.1 hypothetical protein [Cyanobacteria bacterium UBA11159]HBS70941.1 hypothetical protein [Cyanobacteria bacterium UBA11153]HBW89420.1 hypothetical protein [Cyanobacteria bacterium UBA11149]HCA98103.1 hypothetical protein [Cyanobacteria bacterium UBA9226]